MKIRKFVFFSAAAALIFVIMIIAEPEVCTEGAARGLLLCGRVIIPALFPFTACMLFIMKSGVLSHFGFLSRFTRKLFRISPEAFSVMLLSLIGGYPVGARMLNEAVALKKIKPKTAGIMLNYCVNAGPAFVVLAVGSGIVGSKSAGYVLLLSHLLPAVILGFLCRFLIKDCDSAAPVKTAEISITDNFVLSVSESAAAVFSICCYVLFFSAVNSYIIHFSAILPALSKLSFLLEVTSAVTLTRNVSFISFLLGFSGLCVFCQVISVSPLLEINYPFFFGSRILHGTLSALLSTFFFRIFKIPLPTFSSGALVSLSPFSESLALSVSLFCMVIVLLITLLTKKHTGKFLDDLL